MLYNPCNRRNSFCDYKICHGPFQPCNRPGNGMPPNGACMPGSCFNEYVSIMQFGIGANYSNNYPTKEARTITVFIKNTGEYPIVAFLQNSPNGLDFTQDPQILQLQADETGHLVPYIFSKYTRVMIHSDQPGTACIWFQLQNFSCDPPCHPQRQPLCFDGDGRFG